MAACAELAPCHPPTLPGIPGTRHRFGAHPNTRDTYSRPKSRHYGPVHLTVVPPRRETEYLTPNILTSVVFLVVCLFLF